MKMENLELGAVFQPEWDGRPIRILAFDSQQVMYDSWSTHNGKWGIDSLNQKISYYRLPISLLQSRAQYLRTDEYTKEERTVHRPDLPFSFAAHAELNWSAICASSRIELANELPQTKQEDYDETHVLNVARIYLSPFGPKGSAKPGVLITAKNGSSFTAAEILWQASKLQLPHLRENNLTEGVGIYRSGIQRTLPSYYVWGAKSRMGI